MFFHRFARAFFASSPLVAAILSAVPAAQAFTGTASVAETPFEDPARFNQQLAALPSLGNAQSDDEWNKRLAAIAKDIGEASQNGDNSTSFGQQAGVWAFNHFRDEVANRVESEGQSLLSPYGNAQLDLMVDMQGSFTGTGGDLFTALADERSHLTFSQDRRAHV